MKAIKVIRVFKNNDHPDTEAIFIRIAGIISDPPFNTLGIGGKIYLKSPSYNLSDKTIQYIHLDTLNGEPVIDISINAPYNGDDYSGLISKNPIGWDIKKKSEFIVLIALIIAGIWVFNKSLK